MTDAAPLAMIVSLIYPYDPYAARPEYWNLDDPAQIGLPEEGLAHDPDSCRIRSGMQAPADVESADKIRDARPDYFANVSYFDSNVEKIVQALSEADLLENKIVTATSEHGDMLVERGLWCKMSWL